MSRMAKWQGAKASRPRLLWNLVDAKIFGVPMSVQYLLVLFLDHYLD